MKLSKSHKAYFSAAKAVSELGDFLQTKIGCAVIYKHKIISSGYNRCKTAPLQKKYNKYRFPDDDGMHCAHAELMALSPLIDRDDIDFSRVSLYIYREYKHGGLAPCRCCNSCMHLVKELGIRHIYYTTRDGFAHEEIVY